MLLRLDESLIPTRNRLATVSTAELEKLRKVKNIIRKGRLRTVTGRAVVFSNQNVALNYPQKSLPSAFDKIFSPGGRNGPGVPLW